MKDKINLYFIPGMAAGPEIFENIKLPEESFNIHYLKWLIPKKNESLKAYAGRMAEEIEEGAVIAGVSFGGIIAQEIAEIKYIRKVIIISSVKKREELPKRMRWAGNSGLYKMIPTRVVLGIEDFTVFSINSRMRKRMALYQKYLYVRDKQYLDWSIRQIVLWNREKSIPGLIHIQGDEDSVFPIKYIDEAIVIKGGTHAMILVKGREISAILLDIFKDV